MIKAVADIKLVNHLMLLKFVLHFHYKNYTFYYTFKAQTTLFWDCDYTLLGWRVGISAVLPYEEISVGSHARRLISDFREEDKIVFWKH